MKQLQEWDLSWGIYPKFREQWTLQLLSLVNLLSFE